MLSSAVGKGKCVSMSRLAARYASILVRMSGRGERKSLTQGSALREFRRYLADDAEPGVASAWYVGEALRLEGATWSSGLLGLFAAGYLADVVAVIACTDDFNKFHLHDPIWKFLYAASVATYGLVVADPDEHSDYLFGQPCRLYKPVVESKEARAARYGEYFKVSREWCIFDLAAIDKLSDAWSKWLRHRDLRMPFQVDGMRRFPYGVYADACNPDTTLIKREKSIITWSVHNF